MIISITDVKGFKISRGSTVHHVDDDRYPPETNDNWIYFTSNDTMHNMNSALKQ